MKSKKPSNPFNERTRAVAVYAVGALLVYTVTSPIVGFLGQLAAFKLAMAIGVI